ncbi:NERD domain-containing protein [Corynebacterium breve]|uniref:NERD domain-containing protein n=1 Tax=Corynebacterium breve TaxID=3049799 RepID=A0ABY8VFA1_9CORY|nr:NERD domain-containing protein [Corynebacterium breve]WIM67641.1 NERD domain-containing protein [Corynebacterium breve]
MERAKCVEERSERWNAVSPSQFDHEKRGLKALARAVPDAEPYRVWTNFQFTGNDGQDYEVDALVIGRAGIYVVELKDWSGVITGNDHQLEVHPRTGLPYSQRHPVKTTQSKARVLVSRFKNEIAAVVKAAKEVGIDVSRVEQRVPWIQGVVFLTNPRVNVSGVSDIGLQNVYGLDTDSHSPIQDPRLQGIGSCITTAPTDSRREIIEDQSKIILAQAMDRIAGFSRKNKHLGDWVLDEVEDEYDSVRFYSAHRRDDDNLKALLRVITLNPDTQEASFKYEYNLQKREFQRLRELRHDRIDSPDNFFNQGNMIVMVFPRGTGQFEPLDRLLPGVSFTAEQQVQLIQQIAEAVDYAHQNNLSHRNLGPNSVLVDRKALAEGRVVSRVTGWTAAGQIEREGTQTAGLTITPHRSQLVDDMYDMFFPPEYYPEGSDKRLGDLFSIGALAYFIIANGTMPAHNRLALIEKLRITGGLDLGETGSEVEPEFRHLVRGITAAQPSQRAKAVRKPNSAHDEPNPVRAFIQRLQEVTDERVSDVADPANPALNAKINDRFRVDEVLGAGSTARGLLVTDLQDIDADQRVLKVALDEDKHGRLDGEAATIQEIHEKLPKSVNPQRFVQLIEGPLKLQHGRYGLLLSVCGSRTLADVLGSSMPMGQQFWMLGLQLVEILVALEETGVFHRDIKPSNLGVVGKPSEMRLSLFDFSLSKDPLTAIEAGTAQYRDPFWARSGLGLIAMRSATPSRWCCTSWLRVNSLCTRTMTLCQL